MLPLAFCVKLYECPGGNLVDGLPPVSKFFYDTEKVEIFMKS